MPVDSPTQRRIRTDQSLSRYFDQRAPPPGVGLGVRAPPASATRSAWSAAFGSTEGEPFLLDVLGLPTPRRSRTPWSPGPPTDGLPLGLEEALIFAPTDTAYADDVLVRARDRARTQRDGRLLVERRHYELRRRLPSWPPTPSRTSRFERLGDAEDPRLAACHREVMRDTLDAHDRALIDRPGLRPRPAPRASVTW